MKHISILPLYDATLTSIDSSHQLFSRVNDFMKYQGRPPFYDIEVVSLEKNTRLSNGLYTVKAGKTINELSKTDVIILPLLCGNFTEAIKQNKPYTNWLINQYNQGAEIVCLCVGSFYLASTGLLNDKECAVHWAAQQQFRQMFPDVQVIKEGIITHQQGIYTCGGGYAYLNLLLYVIEKHLGREVAVLASKMFEIDMERSSQQPFTIFMGQKVHGDEMVLKAQELIESHPSEMFTVDNICRQLNTGRRTFERRFKQATGKSLMGYVRSVKVEMAKKMLETGSRTISEIVYETGYNDIDNFRKVFQKITSLSPVAYRKKYNPSRY